MIAAAILGAFVCTCGLLYFLRYRGSSAWPVQDGAIEGFEIKRWNGSAHRAYYAVVRYHFLAAGGQFSGSWNSPSFGTELELQQYLSREWPRDKRVFVKYKPETPANNFLELDSWTYTDDRPVSLNLQS